jgi:hypothetical protein
VSISDIRALAAGKQIVWTEHLSLRLRERNIKRSDIIYCIENGEIIEQYPDAYPFPACLIFVMMTDNKPIHTAVGIGGGKLFIITVYEPTLDEWENDCKTRKAENK